MLKGKIYLHEEYGERGKCPRTWMNNASNGGYCVRSDRFKTNLQFILLPYRNLYAALDACKAADYVIFVLSPDVEVDSWGELAMRSLQAQGLPETNAVLLVSTPDYLS